MYPYKIVIPAKTYRYIDSIDAKEGGFSLIEPMLCWFLMWGLIHSIHFIKVCKQFWFKDQRGLNEINRSGLVNVNVFINSDTLFIPEHLKIVAPKSQSRTHNYFTRMKNFIWINLCLINPIFLRWFKHNITKQTQTKPCPPLLCFIHVLQYRNKNFTLTNNITYRHTTDYKNIA